MTPAEAANIKMEVMRCYRGLFLDDKGTLKPEGEVVLRDLERVTGCTVHSLPTDNDGAVDPYRAVANLQQQRTYVHVKKMLYGKMTELKRVTETNQRK